MMVAIGDDGDDDSLVAMKVPMIVAIGDGGCDASLVAMKVAITVWWRLQSGGDNSLVAMTVWWR